MHTGSHGQWNHESVAMGFQNPVNISVTVDSDKFAKFSEDNFIGGHSFDEENSIS